MQPRERSCTSARDSLTSFDPSVSQDRSQFPTPRSKAFGAVLHQVARFAGDDSITIVFEGETGTGKTWLARRAHQLSTRSGHEFHEKSVATITDSLACSDLFGHVLGAFTDARSPRPGAFQSANHGTLFLDELGKATPEVQRLLLRAIEERVIFPVGTDRPIKVDVRLMVATNVSLESLAADGRFLTDLYARLGPFRVYLPPLRERREDIPDLARYFLAQHALRNDYSIGLPTIHPALMTALHGAEWRFNLRELDGALRYLVLQADSAAELTLEHCAGPFEYLREHVRGRPTKSSAASVAAAVMQTDSIADAARALSLSRSTIYRKLAKLKADSPIYPVAEIPLAD